VEPRGFIVDDEQCQRFSINSRVSTEQQQAQTAKKTSLLYDRFYNLLTYLHAAASDYVAVFA